MHGSNHRCTRSSPALEDWTDAFPRAFTFTTFTRAFNEGETIRLFDVLLGVAMGRSIKAIKINGERRALEVKMGKGGYTIKRSSKLGTLY